MGPGCAGTTASTRTAYAHHPRGLRIRRCALKDTGECRARTPRGRGAHHDGSSTSVRHHHGPFSASTSLSAIPSRPRCRRSSSSSGVESRTSWTGQAIKRALFCWRLTHSWPKKKSYSVRAFPPPNPTHLPTTVQPPYLSATLPPPCPPSLPPSLPRPLGLPISPPSLDLAPVGTGHSATSHLTAPENN